MHLRPVFSGNFFVEILLRLPEKLDPQEKIVDFKIMKSKYDSGKMILSEISCSLEFLEVNNQCIQ